MPYGTTEADARTTRSTVEALLQGLEAGKSVAELFAEQVDWDIPGAKEVPWIGRRSTRAEVAGFFDSLHDHVIVHEFRVTQILVDGRDAVLLGRLHDTVKATGRPLTTAFAIHLTVEKGHITRYHLYEDSYAVARAVIP
ncbi:SnoaL-like domain-containing protein [Pyxidicoccus fallax]|uniref:SnoaL-like domain-containing protein n=2 Tax=Pyxidicoccus fallax TaxID=394095 RepID=A0A848LJJ8_9BACT|nr:SnoaL-like domain-containing protein [Pyxidicoccus fallax]NPC79737.1 SnoaL-like domain-containing protein [Pyxidicoccus fallax]